MLSTVTGAVVSRFKAPLNNGIGSAIRLTGGRLLVGGSFTTVSSVAHAGVVA